MILAILLAPLAPVIMAFILWLMRPEGTLFAMYAFSALLLLLVAIVAFWRLERLSMLAMIMAGSLLLGFFVIHR